MNRFFDNIPMLKGKVPGKIILSLLMLVYAFCLCIFIGRTDRMICFIAMFAAFLGDFFLNHVNLEKRTKKDFYLGTLAFICAHIIYIIAYYEQIKENNFQIFNAGFDIAGIIIYAIIFAFTLMKKKASFNMYALGVMYLLTIGLNCAMIFSFSYSIGNIKSLAALGAILFLVSDLFIGIETFTGLKSKVIRELVWWFYPIGQIIIITMG